MNLSQYYIYLITCPEENIHDDMMDCDTAQNLLICVCLDCSIMSFVIDIAEK